MNACSENISLYRTRALASNNEHFFVNDSNKRVCVHFQFLPSELFTTPALQRTDRPERCLVKIPRGPFLYFLVFRQQSSIPVDSCRGTKGAQVLRMTGFTWHRGIQSDLVVSFPPNRNAKKRFFPNPNAVEAHDRVWRTGTPPPSPALDSTVSQKHPSLIIYNISCMRRARHSTVNK